MIKHSDENLGAFSMKGQNMNIKTINPSDLRKMKDKEGLILQGCGGDPKEWVDGINKLLTESSILLDNTKFEDVISFQNDSSSCLLFEFNKDVHLDVGKLAMWRLQTHNAFAGTWLSDYVPNRLGGFEVEKHKPNCPLIGQDSNIFNLMGIASRTLKDNGLNEEAKEMCFKITNSGSYDEALGIISEYVNITDDSENIEMSM